MQSSAGLEVDDDRRKSLGEKGWARRSVVVNGVEPSGAAVFEAVLGREELFFPFLKGNSTLVKTAGGPARAGGGLEELRKGVEWCASAMTKVVTPWDIIA